MLWIIFLSVGTGLLVGLLGWVPSSLQSSLNDFITYGICIIVFSVGVSVGRNREVWKQLRILGFQALYLPMGVVLGTMLGSLLVPLVVSMGLRESMAVGSGFGWYSLSGVLLTKLHSVELGSIAFLSNVFRELLAVLLIPLLARHAGPFTVISPGGATTMDTTLPLIDRFTPAHGALLAFLNGFALSLLVPLLVPLIIHGL